MLRKRALRGVVALVLALGLFAATGVQAAGGPPSQGLSGFWTSVELWFQDLAADWFGVEPKAAGSVVESPEQPSPTDPGDGTLDPGSQDGDSGATSTTDEGPGSDPNG